MNATTLHLKDVKEATVPQAALLYQSAGISVLPCRGKRPALTNWSHLQERIAAPDTIAMWRRAGLLENVGIICGAVSGNLVVMDCDGVTAVNLFHQHFPKLVDRTYEVISGSGVGAHFYFYVDQLPPTTRLTNYPTSFGMINLELRSTGTYVVAPPSIHPGTHERYVAPEIVPILRLADMSDVVNWLKSLMLEKHAGVMPPAAGRPKHERAATPNTSGLTDRNGNPVRNPQAFWNATLRHECGNVRAASTGGRNAALYKAALKLGSLIADGCLDRATVERDLSAAAHALAETDGQESVDRTIASGLNRGVLSSREQFTNKQA